MRDSILILLISLFFVGCKNNETTRNFSGGKDELIAIATEDIKNTLASVNLEEYEFGFLDTHYYPIANNKIAEDLTIVFNKKGSKRTIPVGGGSKIEYDSIRVWYSSHEGWRQGTIIVSNAGDNKTTVIFSDKTKKTTKK